MGRTIEIRCTLYTCLVQRLGHMKRKLAEIKLPTNKKQHIFFCFLNTHILTLVQITPFVSAHLECPCRRRCRRPPSAMGCTRYALRNLFDSTKAICLGRACLTRARGPSWWAVFRQARLPGTTGQSDHWSQSGHRARGAGHRDTMYCGHT